MLPGFAGTAHAAVPVTRRVAVVVIQNGDTTAEQTQLADTTYYRNIFFGTADSLATWMPAVTHGLLSYTAAGDGVFAVQPSDELRNADKSGCHTGPARTTAEDHLKSLGVTWDSLAVVFDIASCGWGGLGQVPGKVTWYPPRPSLSAIVHEFGHNQGYPHQPKRDCAGGDVAACKENGYSGNTPMGSGGAGRGYSSVELIHSGWAEPSWRVTATAPGTFSLKPLHSPAGVTGARILEYKASSTLTYVVETRAPGAGVDSGVSNPGVRVYAVTRGDYKGAYLINPGTAGTPYTPAGTVITDTASKIAISVRSSSAASAQVAIEAIRARPATKSASPSASPSPSPSTVETPSSTPSADVVPDDDSDLLDAAAAPSKNGGLKTGTLLLITGALMALILVSVTGYMLRPDRHRPRHRKPLFQRP
jgi:hypothetical protein